MGIEQFYAIEGEKPFDNFFPNGGFTGIFRTIACIGDSLSSGEHESMMGGKKGFHDYMEYSWGQYIARDTGSKVYNFSKGGMDVRKYCEEFAHERGFWDEDKAAQAYIIALGVNDTSRMMEGNMEFGDISDVHPDDPESNGKTFAGYYGKIISNTVSAFRMEDISFFFKRIFYLFGISLQHNGRIIRLCKIFVRTPKRQIATLYMFYTLISDNIITSLLKIFFKVNIAHDNRIF